MYLLTGYSEGVEMKKIDILCTDYSGATSPNTNLVVYQDIPGDTESLVDFKNNPAVSYLLGLRSETSRYQMMRKLDKVAYLLGKTSWRIFSWSSLEPVHISALVTQLASEYKPAYVNAILAAIRGVMECAFDQGEISAETYRLIRKVKPVRGGSMEPAGRYVNGGERAALMDACLRDVSPAGRRDAAVLVCAYPGGLRRGEIASLTREAILDDGETMSLKVLGKGRKERIVYMSNGGADALRDWLEYRGESPGILFWAGRKGGHLVEGQGISSQSLNEIIKRRAGEAKIRDLVTHDLRRTTASDLLDITDAVTVAGHLGHASTNTTAKYDRRGERARKKAAQGLHMPYKRRNE
jgi:integrase